MLKWIRRGLLLGLALMIGVHLWIQWQVDGLRVDNPQAILVLGARVYPDKPSRMLAERLDVAAKLYKEGKAPLIVLSGGVGPGYDEPTVMAQYLKDIPASALILDRGGLNSYRSLYRLKHQYHIDRALIATTAYHLPRCLYLGKSLGLEVEGVAAPNRSIYNMPYNYLREWLAEIKAVLNVTIWPPHVDIEP